MAMNKTCQCDKECLPNAVNVNEDCFNPAFHVTTLNLNNFKQKQVFFQVSTHQLNNVSTKMASGLITWIYDLEEKGNCSKQTFNQ